MAEAARLPWSHLDQWIQDKSVAPSNTDSVFLEKWYSLVRRSYRESSGIQLNGILDERQFDAILSSFDNQSWKQATSEDGCEDPFCFWYDRCAAAADGNPCSLTNNNRGMVPRGMLSYPIALNLKKESDQNYWRR